MIYNEDSEVTQSSLKQLIANVEVSDAILVYNLMVKKNINISNELRQSFLELICFTNHEDSIAEELIEERWFSQTNSNRERQRKTWKDGDLAETIFNQIEPQDSHAYCSIIRGMCKYVQVERGYALYQDALQKGLHIDVTTFNAVIQVSNFLRESGDMRWQLVQELLQTMASQNIKPNLGTLNAVLSVNNTISGTKARECALQTLAEFNALGIVPSLESWYFILSIFCRERGPVSHVLVDILNQIEGKEFQINGLKDTYFFVTAVEVCRNHLNDKSLAKRVNSLLHVGHNYDLIGDSYKESVYYRHYFALLCNTEPLDVFMETYDMLVPNIYIPEPGIMTEILKQVDINGALELIPRFWSDIVVFELSNRETIIEQVLKIMVENVPNKDLPKQVDLKEKFSSIAWQIWTKIEEQPEGRNIKLAWTGPMISNVLTLICRSDDYAKALDVFTKINKNQDEIVGTSNPAALESFIKLSIANKQPSKAIAALQYCVENSFANNEELGRLIVDSMTLDEHHTSKIISLVGVEVVQPRESK